MGSSVYPVSSSGKAKYTQVITSSTTWTAPTVPTYDGMVTVTAVGGGGAGGNGAGGMSWASTSGSQYGSPGGGGGGGGQVIIDQKVPLPAGTAVTVTVGAGGTATPISTTPLNWNYFLNPKLKNNVTGYAATANCTVARLTTPLPPYSWNGTFTGGTLAVTPTSTTGVSFTYDTGNSAFTANSGTGGYRFAMATGGVPAGGQTFTGITITVTWYANATLIRSDVLTTTASMTVNSTNYSQYTILGSTANIIPTNATRFTINFSGNTTNTQPMYFTQFMLMPRELETGRGQTFGTGNQYYMDPDWFTVYPGATVVPLAFSGTAEASTTTVVGGKSWGWNSPDGFGSTTIVGGNPGDGGGPGGDTSFGSYITAKGGGGGQGGGINYWNGVNGSAITGSTIFSIQQSGAVNQSANGGNGGGGGGFCITNNGLYSIQGGGGGGAGGYPYFANTSLVNSNTLPVNGPVLNTKGGNGIQWSGGGGGSGTPYSGGNNLSILGTASSGGYSPTMGGVRLNGFGGGGIGGSAGSNIPHKAEAGTGVYNSINASADVTAYATLSGLPQRGSVATTNYASSGGAPATNATAGANGINYGDGGTGGNGGAGATSTTLNGTTIANPGKGSSGGSGAQGIVIVEWWQ